MEEAKFKIGDIVYYIGPDRFIGVWEIVEDGEISFDNIQYEVRKPKSTPERPLRMWECFMRKATATEILVEKRKGFVGPEGITY